MKHPKKIKTILIIADLFHASPRIPGIAKYLSEYGFNVIILTGNLGNEPHLKFAISKEQLDKNSIRLIEINYFKPLEFFRKILKFSSKKNNKISENTHSNGINVTVEQIFLAFYKLLGMIIAYPDWERFWKKPAVKKCEEIINNERIDCIISSSSPSTAHIIAKKIKEKYRIPWIAD